MYPCVCAHNYQQTFSLRQLNVKMHWIQKYQSIGVPFVYSVNILMNNIRNNTEISQLTLVAQEPLDFRG